MSDTGFKLKEYGEIFRPTDPANQSKPKSIDVKKLAIDTLSPFKNHPFRLYEGERLDDMVESIRTNGVLIPLIARLNGTKREILSGHNRMNAAKFAGLSEVPVILLENISDNEAQIYIVETNLMQRSFSDMCHSEKAAIIATHHSRLFSQGKRNDIIVALQMLENPNNTNENGTCSQVANKSKSVSKVGHEYGLSKDTIARYLRINKLNPALKSLLDNGDIAFIPAVTVSYLNAYEQEELAKCIELNRFAVDIKKANLLREFSENRKLDNDSIYFILNGEIGLTPKSNRAPTVKVSKAVYAKYFNPGQSAKEIQKIVEEALERYFNNK